MKTVVLLNELSSSDIIDHGIYEDYVKYLEDDINKYFLQDDQCGFVACPGCGQQEGVDAYIKIGLSYQRCKNCGTYYVNPRPSDQDLQNFYKNSKACIFWRDSLRDVSEAHWNTIYGSRMNWIADLADEFLDDTELLVDFETKHSYFIEKMASNRMFRKLGMIRPQLFEKMEMLPNDILVDNALDDYKGKVSVITAFDTIERMVSPEEFFKLSSQICIPGGLMLLTTASSTGFEYQILGENAPNINPINRMNLLSLSAITDLIQKSGFEIIELSTPGRLDIEIVQRVMQEQDDVAVDGFWKYVFKNGGEKTLQSLQSFLQENRLSSHVRIAARKK